MWLCACLNWLRRTEDMRALIVPLSFNHLQRPSGSSAEAGRNFTATVFTARPLASDGGGGAVDADGLRLLDDSSYDLGEIDEVAADDASAGTYTCLADLAGARNGRAGVAARRSRARRSRTRRRTAAAADRGT